MAYKTKQEKKTKDDHPEARWFKKEDLQYFAKFSGDILKKTISSSLDTLKEAKGNIPKEAVQFLTKSKDEILKTLSHESMRNLFKFGVEKVFETARRHHLEFSLRIRIKKSRKKKQKK